MGVISKIQTFAAELTAIRQDLHSHPELGFEETRTSGLVAENLRSYGVDEVFENIGGTGVVALIKGQGVGNRRIGLRADMDALPIMEASGVPFESIHRGRMHACGHDGHTTMLLGATRYLADTRKFDGTAVLIFQPAEEGLGGARRMIAEGLFDKFPCDEIYGMHNDPNSDPGVVSVTPGTAMAGATFFDITVTGKGSHAAMPHQSKDPIVAGTALVQQLQTIVSRNVDPTMPAIVSVTRLNAGSAYNVLPDTMAISGTIRYFHNEVSELVEERIRDFCVGIELAYNVSITAEMRNVFDVLVNDPELSSAYLEAAADIVGIDKTFNTADQMTVSEDFADMLKLVPGAYCRIGHAGSIPLHSPAFVFDDEILPVGASIYARIIETRLPLDKSNS
jgi:amidohydrolase